MVNESLILLETRANAILLSQWESLDTYLRCASLQRLRTTYLDFFENRLATQEKKTEETISYTWKYQRFYTRLSSTTRDYLIPPEEEARVVFQPQITPPSIGKSERRGPFATVRNSGREMNFRWDEWPGRNDGFSVNDTARTDKPVTNRRGARHLQVIWRVSKLVQTIPLAALSFPDHAITMEIPL